MVQITLEDAQAASVTKETLMDDAILLRDNGDESNRPYLVHLIKTIEYYSNPEEFKTFLADYYSVK